MPMPVQGGGNIATPAEIDAAAINIANGFPHLNPPPLRTQAGIQAAIAAWQAYQQGFVQRAAVVEFPTPAVPSRHVELSEPGEVIEMPRGPEPRPIEEPAPEPTGSIEVPIPLLIGGLALMGGLLLTSAAGVTYVVYRATK